MNKWTRILALVAALMMLSLCAFAEEASMPSDVVLATVGDEELTLAEVDEVAYMLYYYGYVEKYPDYASAVDYLVQTTVIENHIRAAGYDQFPEEEMAAFRNEAAAEWNAMLEEYVVNYLTEDTEEARAALREQAEAYYNAYGYSEESVLEEMLITEGYARLEEVLLDGYVPSEEEILAVFNEYGAQYQQMFENDVATYEYYTNYYGYDSWYVPAGYRSVLHILLEVDEEILSAWQSAQVALDEAASAETVDEAAVKSAQEALDAAKAAVLESKKAELDDIYARLEQGEDFKTLIAEYNIDDGMKNEEILADGYHVHPESIVYDMDFVAGAFQERMAAPGDYSDPVVSQFGIHVLHYLRDVESGLIMSDSVHEELADYLVSAKMDAAYTAAMPEWEAALTIVVDDALIEKAQQEADAAVAQSETVTE